MAKKQKKNGIAKKTVKNSLANVVRYYVSAGFSKDQALDAVWANGN